MEHHGQTGQNKGKGGKGGRVKKVKGEREILIEKSRAE